MAVRENDIGVVFRITITKNSDGTVLDISSATTREIVFRRPSGVIVTKTAVVTNSGTDGKMEYVSEADFLNETGNWKLQGHVIVGSNDLTTEMGAFSVNKVLD